MNIKHVVVASDLSDFARTAYPHAVAMALATGARVTLVHVDDFGEFELGESAEQDAFSAQVIKLRQEKLTADLAYLRRWVPAEAEVLRGRAKDQISAFCRQLGDTLLVLSRRGYRDTPSFSQSTAANVAVSAGCAVLVTPALDPADLALPDAPFVYHRAIFPTDFSDDSQRGLAWVNPLLQKLSAKLMALNVLRQPFFAHLKLDDVGLEQIKVAAEERLQTQLAALDIEAEPLVLLGDSPAVRIAEYVRQHPPELVVLPTHGHHARRDLIGHTTQEFLGQSTPSAVLVLPREVLTSP